MQHLAPSAEEARPPDDGGRDGVEHDLPTVEVVRHAAEVGSVEQTADAGGEGTEDEAPGPDRRQVDPGAARRFRVAADGIDVAAETGSLHQHHPHG